MFGFNPRGYLTTNPMPADAELLQRYADDHSEDAFAELVRRHLDGVYSSALRRVGGDTHLAQDVAQAVFSALARQSRALASHPFLTAWLYATTRNEAANTVRRERRRKTREAVASAMNEINDSPSAEATADWSRLSPVLDDAIDQLSETDRAAILLRFIDRRPFAEIGAQLRVTEDAARMRVDRALDKLRLLLTRRGITSTSAALSLILANHAVAAAPATLAITVTAASFATLTTIASIGGTILSFMSTTKTTLTLAALACAFAATLATHQIATARAADAALTADQKQEAALLARLRELRNEVQAAENSVTLPPPTAPLPRSAAPSADVEDPRATGLAFLARHPDVKQALVEHSRALVNFTWAPFFQTANLTPDQIEQFTEIIAASQWFGPGAAPGEKPMILGLGNSSDPNEGEQRLRELLGDELYQKRVEFGRSIAARKFTFRIASTLAFSDEPLTASQAASLAPIIANSKAAKSPNRATSFDWDAIVTKSQNLLTASQLAMIEGMRAQDEYQWASTEAAKHARESITKTSTAVSP